MAARKVLILGATGGTGRLATEYALQQGHALTVLVRDPRRLAVPADRMRVLVGDLMLDDGVLEEAVQGQDVVVSALGRGTSFSSGGLITHSLQRIVRAMESSGVGRLIVTSGFGVGETYPDLPLIPRLFSRLVLRDIYRDKHEGEQFVRGSRLVDWTIVYPSALTDGPPTGHVHAGEHLRLRGMPRIARADVAHFLVAQIDDETYLRKGVLISS